MEMLMLTKRRAHGMRHARRSSLSTAEEKTCREGRTHRWMKLAVTEDSRGVLVILEQSRHFWYVTVDGDHTFYSFW
ncbi:unnamed protein product [Brassica oleracea]